VPRAPVVVDIVLAAAAVVDVVAIVVAAIILVKLVVVIVVVDEVVVDHGVDVIIVEQSERESTEMFPSHVAKKSHVAPQPVG
jgi:hypothetical protein